MGEIKESSDSLIVSEDISIDSPSPKLRKNSMRTVLTNALIRAKTEIRDAEKKGDVKLIKDLKALER